MWFFHSIISLNMYFTWRNHVKIFQPPNILLIWLKYCALVYSKNLSIGTYRSKKTMQSQTRLPSDRVIYCLAYHLQLLVTFLHWNSICSVLKAITILSSFISIFRKFTEKYHKKHLLIASNYKNRSLWAVTMYCNNNISVRSRSTFKIIWNLVLYASLCPIFNEYI